MADMYDKLTRFEEYYHYLESSFIDTARIIPLENKPDTFSPRLYEILQSTCSQIDGMLNLMREEYLPKNPDATLNEEPAPAKEKPAGSTCENVPRRNKPTAAVAYEILNREGVISDRVLAHKMRPNWKEIRPFLCDYKCAVRSEDADPHKNATRDGMPKWWNAYNESKHDLPKGYEAGSMENAYLALAGLYVLHVMARQYYRDAHTFVKKDSWATRILISYGRTMMDFSKPAVVKPPSEIFIPKIEFLLSG